MLSTLPDTQIICHLLCSLSRTFFSLTVISYFYYKGDKNKPVYYFVNHSYFIALLKMNTLVRLKIQNVKWDQQNMNAQYVIIMSVNIHELDNEIVK